jgi:hypothetical protein
MINLEKVEFLNLAGYLAELKQAVMLLYKTNEIVMSSSAHDDLEKITLKQITPRFTLEQLAEWQQGNELIGVKTYNDYIHFGLHTVNEIISLQLSDEKNELSIHKALSKEELKTVRLSLGHWDAFSNLFYRQINHLDTLKIILKNAEDTQAKLTGYITTGDENDIIAFYSDKITQANSIIRKKIHDLETMAAPLSGMPTPEKLVSTLKLEEWENIFIDLVDKKYLPFDYKKNSILIHQWLNFAFTNSTDQSPNKNQKLRWIADLMSLAQWVNALVKIKAILYNENDKARLYEWVNRAIEFQGERNTLETNLRRTGKNKVQSFEASQSIDGKFVFKIFQTAKRPKTRAK